ncbi:hypothetical protein ZIOFF_060790 [Zingiber officinale]|uniref:Uncharacterized protein n=1 Tax=Zingiber officinale TaxID=94328 RepID=A0A8J5FB63_ZINOF|nr:hypothetical protein ZIOFF_060790 [Zingiber officinale]
MATENDADRRGRRWRLQEAAVVLLGETVLRLCDDGRWSMHHAAAAAYHMRPVPVHAQEAYSYIPVESRALTGKKMESENNWMTHKTCRLR